MASFNCSALVSNEHQPEADADAAPSVSTNREAGLIPEAGLVGIEDEYAIQQSEAFLRVAAPPLHYSRRVFLPRGPISFGMRGTRDITPSEPQRRLSEAFQKSSWEHCKR
jgi:hypothetical protein